MREARRARIEMLMSAQADIRALYRRGAIALIAHVLFLALES
jgi:hypothetical protein